MSTEMADVILAETSDKMAKAVTHAKAEFSTIRTGRAAPALVEKIPVDYYGTEVPLQQLAGFQVPEARMLLITPYDKGAMGAIEKAIQHSDLGLNPSNDGHSIRLSFPPLTQERRKDLVKAAHKEGENARISIRGARHKALDGIKKAKADGLPEDQAKDAGDQAEKLTGIYNKKVDELIAAKEKDIMKV